ncbi:MAG TPA: GntR family transcriptional regulator [Opitutaceae bacterium]|nr:GntR family transcriptional regulator [Opitutaceae bacterium]HRJ46924.1 GntR family transcriptional regulator [Opitutaceae bacterium]
MKNVNSDLAYNHIRRRILNGDYLPGASLITEELSKEIGVSRTPVRDALRQLEVDGLVSIRPRLGASVKQVNLKEFREICEMRVALESHAAGLAAISRSQEDLAEMEYALQAMHPLSAKLREADREDDDVISALIREDVRFHVAIMTAAKNDLMKKEIHRLHLINRVVSGPAAMSQGARTEAKATMDANRASVMAEHESIFRAISAGDSAAAKHAMGEHIQSIIDKSVRLMSRAESRVLARELSQEEMLYTI